MTRFLSSQFSNRYEAIACGVVFGFAGLVFGYAGIVYWATHG